MVAGENGMLGIRNGIDRRERMIYCRNNQAE
jgi:hypothetical protein